MSCTRCNDQRGGSSENYQGLKDWINIVTFEHGVSNKDIRTPGLSCAHGNRKIR